MSLQSALRVLPDDRLSRTTAESVVRYLYANRGINVSPERVASATRLDLEDVQRVLTALTSGRVLDFVSDPPGYSMVKDRILQIEVELFLRPTRSHTDSLQSNVERYRRMYGGR